MKVFYHLTNIPSLLLANNNTLTDSKHFSLSYIWLIPISIIVILFCLSLFFMYKDRKKNLYLVKKIQQYLQCMQETKKALERIHEPFNELSQSPKMDDIQHDTIRMALWRLNSLQQKMDALIEIDNQDQLLHHLVDKDPAYLIPEAYDLKIPQANENQFLAPLIGNPDPNDQVFLEKMFGHIRENYTDPKFNVDLLSQKMGMSRSTFYNRIKGISGEAPADFIRHYRLERARELLKTNQYTISEIAFKTGFSDVKYFREVFRKKYRQSPTQFMKESR
jgi:AraC-like DNA-binding protein